MNSACHKNNHTMQKFFSLSGFAEEEKRDLGRDSKKIKFLEISNKALSPARPPPFLIVKTINKHKFVQKVAKEIILLKYCKNIAEIVQVFCKYRTNFFNKYLRNSILPNFYK